METTKAIYILFTFSAHSRSLWIGFFFCCSSCAFDSLRKRTARRYLPCIFLPAAVHLVYVCVGVCARTVVGFNFIFLTSFGVSAKLFGIAPTLYIHLHKQQKQQLQLLRQQPEQSTKVNALINDLETHHNTTGQAEQLKLRVVVRPLKAQNVAYFSARKTQMRPTFTATLGRCLPCQCACLRMCVCVCVCISVCTVCRFLVLLLIICSLLRLCDAYRIRMKIALRRFHGKGGREGKVKKAEGVTACRPHKAIALCVAGITVIFLLPLGAHIYIAHCEGVFCCLLCLTVLLAIVWLARPTMSHTSKHTHTRGPTL